MDTCMTIEIEFTDNAFYAMAIIEPDRSLAVRSFTFILNNDLSISEIMCNEKKTDYVKVAEVKPSFRPDSQKISVQSKEDIHNIVIKYSGTVSFSISNKSCWHNIITRDIKSLSWYSVWYPQETSLQINHDKVILLNGSDYFLVKGNFNETRNIWEYGDKGYDPYNIMVYRKEILNIISNPFMNIYFIDDKIKEYAQKSELIYRDILGFYNGNLFRHIDIPVLDVACASPAITIGGGYRRKDLMWCTSLGNNDIEITWLNAHETAHIWCSGANCSTWEDWLNETTAEWATLLFALHKNDMSLFDYILKPKLERFNLLPSIKTPDGSRPDGVHDKGTVIFYEMYKKFGVDAVSKVIRLFTDLEYKSTDSLLQKLYSEKQNNIADFIKESIII